MLRPALSPSHETVPIISTLTPTRCCSVSRTFSVPSSTKLIGLTWMPTNLWLVIWFRSRFLSSAWQHVPLLLIDIQRLAALWRHHQIVLNEHSHLVFIYYQTGMNIKYHV